MKEKNAEISARIDEMINLLHTNPNKLANALGYGRAQTIYDILNGKSAPSYDFFKRFLSSGYAAFINLNWLISGKGSPIIEETYYQSDLPIIKGEMTAEQAKQKLDDIRNRKNKSSSNTEYSAFNEQSSNTNVFKSYDDPNLNLHKKENNQISPKYEHTRDSYKPFEHLINPLTEPEGIPLVSVKAVGGFAGKDFSIQKKDVEAYYVIPKFRNLNVDFLIEVIGDSMMPRLFPGDIIACSVIRNPNFIQWNKTYLIATDEQGMIVKRLKKSSEKGSLLAVSDNVDYDPFDIPMSDIKGLARVVGVIHAD